MTYQTWKQVVLEGRSVEEHAGEFEMTLTELVVSYWLMTTVQRAVSQGRLPRVACAAEGEYLDRLAAEMLSVPL